MADEFVERVTRRAAEYAEHRGADAIGAVDVQLALERGWGLEVPGLPARSAQRPAALPEPFAYRRVDVTKPVPSVDAGAPAAATGGGAKRKAPG